MIRLAVFMPIYLPHKPCRRKIGWVHVDQVAGLKWQFRKNCQGIAAKHFAATGKLALKATDHALVTLDANVFLCRALPAHDDARPQMAFHIPSMRRHEVNQVLIATAFAAWVSHARSSANPPMEASTTLALPLSGVCLAATPSSPATKTVAPLHDFVRVRSPERKLSGVC
ncbi:hypothetical protein FQZ97_943100 [compost metagenome]